MGFPSLFIKGEPSKPKNGLFSSFTKIESLLTRIGSNSSWLFGSPFGPINTIFPLSSMTSFPSSSINGNNSIPYIFSLI